MSPRRRYSDEERLDRKRLRQMLAARVKRELTYTRGPYSIEDVPPEIEAARQQWLERLWRAVQRGRLTANQIELGEPAIGRRSASRTQIVAMLG